VTAGPTVEPIDPVRYISNRSTGIMGYSIAEECLKKGFSVCLISGPVALEAPAGIETVKVFSAQEMYKEVMARTFSCECLIMAAAVCDFRPQRTSKRKIKKKKSLQVTFVKNKDILMDLRERHGFVKVGFALETEKEIYNGEKKLKSKRLDVIVVNKAGGKDVPFGESRTNYVIIGKNGDTRVLKGKTKAGIARVITAEAAKLMEKKENGKNKK